MQNKTISAELYAAAKSLKQLDTETLQARLNDRSYLDSLGLSDEEEKALINVFLNNNNTDNVADWE
ncbi:hypothetical protein [Paenibacillus sp. FSL H8-0034]|uniref:hypothetical protein n=1 Tax=Paenibacillus sp. FSL H8-0034 TaxID=2954671 RepID=UPI0030F705C0